MSVDLAIRDPGAIVAAMVLYLAVCMGIGWLAMRRTRSLADYILGGRKLGSVVTAFSTSATDMSGWLLMGFPALAYLGGFEAVWFAAGSLFFAYLNWKLVAPRLRAQTAALGDALTLPDYFEARLDDRSGLIRALTAVVILVFFTLYTSSGFVAGGRLLETLFDLDYRLCVLISGVVIVGYVVLGGFLAVSWADVLQGLMMLVALLIVAFLGVEVAGGAGELLSKLDAHETGFLSPWMETGGKPLDTIAIISLVAFAMGYPGQPHILARFMATSSVDNLPVARRVALTWQFTVLAAAIVIGWCAVVVVPGQLEGADAEKVFILMSVELLPPWIAGICLAGIAAAVMSTAAAQLLVASSAATEDLYRRYFRRVASERRLLTYGRLAVLAVTALGMLIALKPDETVFSLVAWAWAGFGATFGPAVVLCLMWRGTTRNGVLVGMLVGASTVLLWPLGSGEIFRLYELVPAMTFAILATVAVSLLDQRRSRRAV
jgi:sodium/proline symporter